MIIALYRSGAFRVVVGRPVVAWLLCFVILIEANQFDHLAGMWDLLLHSLQSTDTIHSQGYMYVQYTLTCTQTPLTVCKVEGCRYSMSVILYFSTVTLELHCCCQ